MFKRFSSFDNTMDMVMEYILPCMGDKILIKCKLQEACHGI